MCADISDTRDKSEREGQQDLVYNHIILLAKNQIGLDNLNKISELSWTDGFFKKPRFDFEILEKYREGIIVTSACPSSVIVKALEENEWKVLSSPSFDETGKDLPNADLIFVLLTK